MGFKPYVAFGEIYKMSKWQNYPIFVDTNHYGSEVDFDALKLDNCALVINKMFELGDGGAIWVDETFHPNLQKAYNAKMPYGGYIFVNNAYWSNAQVTEGRIDEVDALFDSGNEDNSAYAKAVLAQDPHMRQLLKEWVIGDPQIYLNDPNKLKTLKKRVMHLLVLDMERWWLNYDNYIKNRKDNPSAVLRVNSFWINKTFKVLIDRIGKFMRMGYIPQVEIWTYTAKWFLDYSPDFGDTISKYNVWWAKYPNSYWPSGTIKTTLTNFKNVYLAPIPDNYYLEEYSLRNMAWQISGDKFIIPSVKAKTEDGRIVDHAVDINLFLGTKEELYTLLKFTEIPNPDPEPEPEPDPDPEPTPNPDLAAIMTKLNSIEETLNEVRAVFK